KNIREADLTFSDKINCFVGLNGQGKTNILDAIYLLSFTKSAFNVMDSQNICHDADMALVQGKYGDMVVSCGLKRGAKKQFRLDKTDYKRFIDHIGLIPLVMVSPEDSQLIAEGSDERRRFMDVVICQQDKKYLEHLTTYNALLKQRNALLKQLGEKEGIDNASASLLEVLELQMTPLAEYIFAQRTSFIEAFTPIFQDVYNRISGGNEVVSLRYISQLQDRSLTEAYVRTRQRDLILGWTSQGIHKDELEMLLGEYPLKRVGSQGQQKTYLLAMKLAQTLYLSRTPNARHDTPILLLDDIFDKLDSERVQRIVELVQSDQFGQIFITDTDRQHLTKILGHTDVQIFHVEKGVIQ
ncbi:MAG: DNA replication and repair protein RecF, partial [Bacteroidales bacterium]|nr:DNA replication and repair protein RecF [Candidatus Colicola caccequi]